MVKTCSELCLMFILNDSNILLGLYCVYSNLLLKCSVESGYMLLLFYVTCLKYEVDLKHLFNLI